jgi:CHAD domain-containing protein
VSSRRIKDWEWVLASSLKERWKSYRRALKRCRHRFSEKSVHASRVETRRLLSLVELLGVFLGQSHLKKTRRILKRHLDAFDPLRDTQVQLLLLAKHRQQFPEVKNFRQTLVKREQRCLETASRRIARVKTHTLQKIFRQLARQLAQVGANASQSTRHRVAMMNAVRTAFSKTLALQRAMDPGAAATIHRTRVAFKKFRYMVEASVRDKLEGLQHHLPTSMKPGLTTQERVKGLRPGLSIGSEVVRSPPRLQQD